MSLEFPAYIKQHVISQWSLYPIANLINPLWSFINPFSHRRATETESAAQYLTVIQLLYQTRATPTQIEKVLMRTCWWESIECDLITQAIHISHRHSCVKQGYVSNTNTESAGKEINIDEKMLIHWSFQIAPKKLILAISWRCPSPPPFANLRNSLVKYLES